MVYFFDTYSLDCDRRELRHGSDVIAVEPQVFDLLQCLIRHRGRVVSKDDLMAEVWNRRVVSESTLNSRITAVRHAVGDSGGEQRLIRTMPRKGFRFVGAVREEAQVDDAASSPVRAATPAAPESAALAAPGAAERRLLTIMVCNVIGAAALSARVDPEDLRDIMTRYCCGIKDAVLRYGGHVAKYNDEGVVAYFGYPQAHEDDAERAVRAALAAITTVGDLRVGGVADPLRASAGIATGPVLVGASMGDDAAPEQAAIGEPPYLAARLQSLCAPGEIAIAAGTREQIGNLFDYGEWGARGNGMPQTSAPSLVLRESAIASRFEALRPTRKELIGRREELDLLLHRWVQAKSGEGRAVLVWGEPGIGKSHLIAAFQDAIAAERPMCMRYFCSPHRTRTALHPVITQIEHAAGLNHCDDDAAKLAALERLLARSSRDMSHDVALFAEFLSVPTAGRYAAMALSAQRRKELLLECFCAQLAGLAAHEPLLLILEDAHWVDPTTRELFDVIIDRVRDWPVLLIMTYRPEFNPAWLGQAHVTALTLNRLGRGDNAALVRQVAGGRDLPQPIVERIVSRTDGVPLFIEEVTKAVLESGSLREESGAYVMDGPLPVVAVPATLQASLIARLDRIAAARTVVQTSAALGREFRYAMLKAVTALSDAELTASLELLVASELVHQRGEIPHAVYVFKHALVQDAAYETLPRSRRCAIQQRVVAVIEAQFPEMAQHHPDVLAHHCTEAGLPAKAIDYRLEAARIARHRSAGVEAQSEVEKAMSLLPALAAGRGRDQVEGRLQLALGDALVMTKGFASPEVIAAMSKARELLDATAWPREALGALCGVYNYHLIRSESPQCLALTQGRLREGLARPTATVMHYLVGTAHLHLGNFGQSVHHLENALRLYDEEACRPVAFIAGYHLRSFTLIWLGLGYLYVGSLKRATETIAAAVADARGRSHPFTLVSALLALARFRSHTGDLANAVAATEEGMAIATEQRSPYHVSRAGVLRAVNLVDSGRADEGIALMEQALAAHRATGADFQSSYNLSCLALAHAQAGRKARAIELATAAIAEVERTGERWWEAEAHRIKGDILVQASAKNRDAAAKYFEAALACARSQGAKLWQLHAALSLTRLRSAAGADPRAGALLKAVRAAFDDGVEINALGEARRLQATLASTRAAPGRRRKITGL